MRQFCKHFCNQSSKRPTRNEWWQQEGKRQNNTWGWQKKTRTSLRNFIPRISFCIHNSPEPPSNLILIRSSFPSYRSHRKHPRVSQWTNHNLISRGAPFRKMTGVSPVGRRDHVTQFWPVTHKKKDPRKTLFSWYTHRPSVSSCYFSAWSADLTAEDLTVILRAGRWEYYPKDERIYPKERLSNDVMKSLYQCRTLCFWIFC